MAFASSATLAGRRGTLLFRRALDPSFRCGCVVINALRRRPACLGGFGAGLNDAAPRTHSSTVVAAAAAAGERGGGRNGGGGAFPSWSSPSSSSSPSPSYPREPQGGGRGSGGGGRGSWSRDGGGGGRGGGSGGRGGDRGDQRRRLPPSSSPSSPANLLVSAGSVALYGINPVSAALAAGRRELIALHVMMEEGERSENEEEGEEEEEGEQRKTTTTLLRGGTKKKPAPNAAAGRGAPARAALSALASSLGARVVRQDKHSLNLMTNNASHQGVVLECGPLEWERTGSLLEAEEERKEREDGGGGGGGAAAAATAATTTAAAATLLSSFSSSAVAAAPPPQAPPPRRIPVWLVLDQVADPQNLGAILRSALFLGAAGVLLSPKNCAPASAAASKASAGALEWLRVSAASRPLPALLREAAREGNWAVLGADGGRRGARGARAAARELLLGGGAPALSQAAAGEGGGSPPAPRPPSGVALVLGSEGAGLRPVVAAECTGFVRVAARRRREGRGRTTGNGGEGGGGGGGGPAAVGSGEGAVDSLNVSVAAALLLHDLLDAFGGEEEEDE